MADFYDTGTLTLTNGATTVVGAGTAFLLAGVKAGDIVYVPEAAGPVPYGVAAVADDTHLTLQSAYAGATGAGKAYYLQRRFDEERAADTHRLLNEQALALDDGSFVGQSIHAAPLKATIADADEFGGADSAAAFGLARWAWATVWAAIKGKIAATASKATPVDADSLYLVDSAAGGDAKRLTIANMRSWLIGGFREKLTANRIYYVRTDGSDANDGLTNTAGGAFLTIQKAINVVGSIDIASFTVTIKLGNSGTWTENIVLIGPWTGVGTVILEGDTATPANTIITNAGSHTLWVKSGGRLTVQYLEARSTGGGVALAAESAGYITLGPGMRFGAAGAYHMTATYGGVILGRYAYTISGGAVAHVVVTESGVIDISAVTVTLTGTPNFPAAYAIASRIGIIDYYSNTFSGTATGVRYSADQNSIIFVKGAGATYLPGNAAGATATGGLYV